MNTEKRKVGTVDLTPSWKTAVTIYCAVLQNPKASAEAHRNAREDLMNLAKAMDKINCDKKSDRCEKNIQPCKRRAKSDDNSCEHFPYSQVDAQIAYDEGADIFDTLEDDEK